MLNRQVMKARASVSRSDMYCCVEREKKGTRETKLEIVAAGRSGCRTVREWCTEANMINWLDTIVLLVSVSLAIQLIQRSILRKRNTARHDLPSNICTFDGVADKAYCPINDFAWSKEIAPLRGGPALNAAVMPTAFRWHSFSVLFLFVGLTQVSKGNRQIHERAINPKS